MKLLAFSLSFVLLAASLLLAQAKPIPPGVRQFDKVEAQTDKSIPLPIEQRAHLDMAKLGQEADELAKIAQTIPPDVASIQKGILPKDVIEKLKRIEKLSKRLRSQINP